MTPISGGGGGGSIRPIVPSLFPASTRSGPWPTPSEYSAARRVRRSLGFAPSGRWPGAAEIGFAASIFSISPPIRSMRATPGCGVAAERRGRQPRQEGQTTACGKPACRENAGRVAGESGGRGKIACWGKPPRGDSAPPRCLCECIRALAVCSPGRCSIAGTPPKWPSGARCKASHWRRRKTAGLTKHSPDRQPRRLGTRRVAQGDDHPRGLCGRGWHGSPRGPARSRRDGSGIGRHRFYRPCGGGCRFAHRQTRPPPHRLVHPRRYEFLLVAMLGIFCIGSVRIFSTIPGWPTNCSRFTGLIFTFRPGSGCFCGVCCCCGRFAADSGGLQGEITQLAADWSNGIRTPAYSPASRPIAAASSGSGRSLTRFGRTSSDCSGNY